MALAVAHRGDWHAVPENTLAAFEAAARAGAGMIELDVRRCADGTAVVVHDATLVRVWGIPRAVADLSLAELGEARVGEERVPALAEVLEAVEAPLMVDYEEDGVVEPALEAIGAAGAFERVVFAGENVDGHRKIRAAEPAARIALTWCRSEPPPDALLDELAVEFFNPPFELVSPAVVEAMHARGTAVSTWTVDDEAQMARVLDAGVDAVITNRIAALVSLLAEREVARC